MKILICPLPSLFFLNTSERVKAVTLAFCGIQYFFIKDIRVKFGTHNSPKSPDIVKNSEGGITDFKSSGQSLINENVRTPEPVIILT